ncbi:cytidine deaminase-like protein [Xylariaceae sp. FL1272]|nr:cytidine deaminase-like protein [Xylariaceae sp. FL1272]
MSDSMKEVVETLDPVSRRLIPANIDPGTLVPLKTTLELRDNLTLGLAYVTRAPTRLTNDVVTIARALASDDAAKNLPHLRRCSKPVDLPAHLKSQFMNEGNGRTIHTGKSNWLYILIGPKDEIAYDELVRGLASIDGIRDDIFIGLIPVPLLAPTSQVQANLWSQQFWQTVYRKNNPLGPHPSSICRTTSVVSRDASVWMTLAHQVAKASQQAGIGEPIGAVIIKRTSAGKPDDAKNTDLKPDNPNGDENQAVPLTSELASVHAALNSNNIDPDDSQRHQPPSEAGDARSATGNNFHDMAGNPINSENQDAGGNFINDDTGGEDLSGSESDTKETTQIVALAADARWYQQEKTGQTGNPMAHAALRAISMVAQKLVRGEDKQRTTPGIMEFEAFQDGPVLDDERTVFEADHPCPDGYLCHELELYLTHEPCVMCAMAILHSRMGRIVFRHRMPLTGGMSSEDRGYDACSGSTACDDGACGGGRGLGLHWRKELNWSMLGWEWETDSVERFAVDPHLHA